MKQPGASRAVFVLQYERRDRGELGWSRRSVLVKERTPARLLTRAPSTRDSVERLSRSILDLLGPDLPNCRVRHLPAKPSTARYKESPKGKAANKRYQRSARARRRGPRPKPQAPKPARGSYVGNLGYRRGAINPAAAPSAGRAHSAVWAIFRPAVGKPMPGSFPAVEHGSTRKNSPRQPCTDTPKPCATAHGPLHGPRRNRPVSRISGQV